MPASTLPQLADGDYYLTDGGLETTLVFLQGIDLPDFAAFPQLDSDGGRAALRSYYTPYLDLAERFDIGFVLDTPTWRANRDWGARLGYDDKALGEVNRRAVDYIVGLTKPRESLKPVLDGVVGPRGDGYVVSDPMKPDEAAEYHSLQARAFAAAGAQMMTAVTMTYAAEAIGVVDAATAEGMPVVVSFTVETDGLLPSGQDLAAAIEEVDVGNGRRSGVLHGELRAPDPLRGRPRGRRLVAGADQGHSRERLDDEPCRARRGRGARPRGRPGPGAALPGAAPDPARPACGRGMLRHRRRAPLGDR